MRGPQTPFRAPLADAAVHPPDPGPSAPGPPPRAGLEPVLGGFGSGFGARRRGEEAHRRLRGRRVGDGERAAAPEEPQRRLGFAVAHLAAGLGGDRRGTVLHEAVLVGHAAAGLVDGRDDVPLPPSCASAPVALSGRGDRPAAPHRRRPQPALRGGAQAFRPAMRFQQARYVSAKRVA